MVNEGHWIAGQNQEWFRTRRVRHLTDQDPLLLSSSSNLTTVVKLPSTSTSNDPIVPRSWNAVISSGLQRRGDLIFLTLQLGVAKKQLSLGLSGTDLDCFNKCLDLGVMSSFLKRISIFS